MLFTYLLKAVTIGFSAGITPGPLQALFLSYAIKGGWRKALPAAFAPLMTDAPVIFLVLVVLNRLPDGFIRGLQIGGAVFLLYLAWDAFRSFRHYQNVDGGEVPNGWQTLLKATLANILGPGPWLFWSMINGPNLLSAWAISPWWGAAYLVSFYTAFVLTNIALIMLFATTRQMGDRVRKALLLVSVFVLVGFAIYQGLQGLLIL